MADERRLVVLLGGRRVGEAHLDDAGTFRFGYDDAQLADRAATPLSLSMPVTRATYGDGPVRAFSWGLLPDSERVLERWAREYQVSLRNPLALLRYVGEDCAGGAQFVRPERVDALLAGEGSVTWLEDGEIEDRLRILRADPTAWHVHSAGQFSLAGTQAKTALHFDERTGRWGDPSGATPTTHILKPAIAGLDDHDLNEHLCLSAAGLAGLPAARTEVVSFGAERVIVVTRYDRRQTSQGQVIRIHQEDMCQAAGIAPMVKYQSEGGPSPELVIDLLRRNVQPSALAADHLNRFVDALAFNWIIAGTDAHAKNYAVLLAGSQVRLAPLYDVASVLPYDDVSPAKLRLAMKIGGEYRAEFIRGRHWRRFAVASGLDPEGVLDRVSRLVARVPDAFAKVAATPAVRSLGSGLPARLAERVADRAQSHARALLD
ncbi:type II toxin-antitoxin system HipA family toxin [Frankia sp. AgB1.9]|uniref:type II toxin-antitoxin system HipA family toxin n=1 Tax=unclassified Frankia TaxID=2632575 RepID=UPI0019324426|nr:MULTISPECIES: type II toxin-antitoxin system HipA family toxin [unclassified Frankia]MBL7493194.1 type II toxin-antitoxin system HipA family toxin [Frankia sp. AgW1.1]MBL7553981.1 type II toxin-antitoxin system HipA family toxin [Frankia sp. AgB1.9]MBL7621064.1 type II toxin-antitoxin system HipA family toxin [Frankia sp. AgB1.8]